MDKIRHVLNESGASFGTGWTMCKDCNSTLARENEDSFSVDALTAAQVSALMGVAQNHKQENMDHTVTVYEFRRKR